MRRLTVYAFWGPAAFFGGGSLLLFGWFLVFGSVRLFQFGVTDRQALAWDGFLSLLFFAQHSGMVRRSFHNWLDKHLARPFHPALYAFASGVVLTAVVLLWQPTTTVLWSFPPSWRLLPRLLCAGALVGFVWGIRSLRDFDTFGLAALRSGLGEHGQASPRFIVRGPYLWVRHPLYLAVIVFFWTLPDVTADRLVFNVLWTVWVSLGARWEERDLVATFGEAYRRYQTTVPMLLPWKGAAGNKLPSPP